jgi:glycosyltransferase involved in cell wall biosynthesis
MKRILFAIPIPYGPDWGFWTRDSGLVVLVLREMGYDAWLVALGDSTTVTTGRPILPVSLDTLQSPDWWRAQKPDGVVLNTWSGPRFDGIRKAALAATPRVVERLDSDGGRSARLFPRQHFIHSWGAYADKLPSSALWLAPVLAAARTAVFYSFPRLMDIRMVETMAPIPALISESPVAAERMGRMIETFSGLKKRIEVIPHPVNEDTIRYTDSPKENRVITVGRWNAFQKDYPLLRKVLQGFLQRHPDWQATVVGKGALRNSSQEEWENRITYHEKLTQEELAAEYSRSKIYLMVSRYESFCIAAGEALCCGCSVVGSSDVPSSYYFAKTESGDVATPRTAKAFLEALDRELACWSTGKRNPATIAAVSRQRMGSHTIARETLALLEDIAAGGAPTDRKQFS